MLRTVPYQLAVGQPGQSRLHIPFGIQPLHKDAVACNYVAAALANVKFKLFHIPSVSILRSHIANDKAFQFRPQQRRKLRQQ